MPHVTFIYPCIGRFLDTKYVRSWQMQPLSIALLSGLTPSNWSKTFFDDRLEDIDYNINTDLVAISVETFTAKRSYQIAKRFQDRGIPVVMGGYHATLYPNEVKKYANAVCIGEAEGIWNKILADVENNSLQNTYSKSGKAEISTNIDRSIFSNKNYLKIGLVETGRGCPFQCTFCSITAFYKAKYFRKSISALVEEIKDIDKEYIFFVDDNLIADFESAKKLFQVIIPLKIKWVSQVSINVATDMELMKLMIKSGCVGVLIGFESLCSDNIKHMNKSVNSVSDYSASLTKIQKAGIRIYGTFMFGNINDTTDLMDQTYRFAVKHKMFLAAFNHIIPFPGTRLYESIKEEGLLKYENWWLSEKYRFGQIPYNPLEGLTDDQIENGCMDMRRKFYNLSSIFKRSVDLQCNCKGIKSLLSYWGLNLLMRRELDQKFGLPLGVHDCNSWEQ